LRRYGLVVVRLWQVGQRKWLDMLRNNRDMSRVVSNIVHGLGEIQVLP